MGGAWTFREVVGFGASGFVSSKGILVGDGEVLWEGGFLMEERDVGRARGSVVLEDGVGRGGVAWRYNEPAWSLEGT